VITYGVLRIIPGGGGQFRDPLVIGLYDLPTDCAISSNNRIFPRTPAAVPCSIRKCMCRTLRQVRSHTLHQTARGIDQFRPHYHQSTACPQRQEISPHVNSPMVDSGVEIAGPFVLLAPAYSDQCDRSCACLSAFTSAAGSPPAAPHVAPGHCIAGPRRMFQLPSPLAAASPHRRTQRSHVSEVCSAPSSVSPSNPRMH